MLICNLISERYKQLKKEQFGMEPCYNSLHSMFNQQLGLYLECSGVTLCYVPETCANTTTVTCELATTQVIVTNSCNLTATQSQ